MYMYEKVTLGCFRGGRDSLRMKLLRVLHSKKYLYSSAFLTFVMAVFATIYDYKKDNDYFLNSFINYFSLLAAFIFLLESFVKMIVMGLYNH